MDEKELKKLMDESNAKLDQLNEAIEKKIDGEAIDTLKKEINDNLAKLPQMEFVEKIQDHLDEMDIQIQKLGPRGGEGKSIDQQITEALKTDAYKAAVKSLKSTKGGNFSFEVKSEEITTSNAFTETNGVIIQRLYDPEIAVDPRRVNSIYDLMSKGTIDSDSVQWLERTTETDNSEQVSEGSAPTSKSTMAWTSYYSNVLDLADYMKVSRNKLDDTSFVRTEIMEMLMNNIPELREQALLTGYDATAVFKGLINATSPIAKDFALPSGFPAVTDPNHVDVLRAALLQVRRGNVASVTRAKGFNANAIVLNPVDIAVLDLQKTDDGVYILPPFATSDRTTIKGVPVVESDWLTAGKFLVGDFSKSKIYVRKNLEISMWEQEASDAINRLVTFSAVWRYALVTKAKYAFAYSYGTFESALGALGVGG